MGRKYNVTDGKLVITLEEAPEGGFTVTSPIEPALITEADSITEAFEMARDALRAIAVSRADPHRWERTSVAGRKSNGRSGKRRRLVTS
jgi:hypothetical protein